MLNYLWGYMILIGIGFGILTGEVEALSNAAIDSTGEAVTMAILCSALCLCGQD